MSDAYTIEAHTVDWIEIITRLLGKRVEGKNVTVLVSDDVATFVVPRTCITAEEIAKAIGSTPDLVTKATKLVLRPIRALADWPKPTVGYYGHA